MSEHLQFLGEREKIDFFVEKGYRIHSVNEHLNGATVTFLHPNGIDIETIQIGTANARKYFSSLLMQQNQV